MKKRSNEKALMLVKIIKQFPLYRIKSVKKQPNHA
jgi:hypothetical protein